MSYSFKAGLGTLGVLALLFMTAPKAGAQEKVAATTGKTEIVVGKALKVAMEKATGKSSDTKKSVFQSNQRWFFVTISPLSSDPNNPLPSEMSVSGSQTGPLSPTGECLEDNSGVICAVLVDLDNLDSGYSYTSATTIQDLLTHNAEIVENEDSTPAYARHEDDAPLSAQHVK